MIRKSVLLLSVALPGTLSAQTLYLTTPLPRPALRVTLGPVTLRATLEPSGIAVRSTTGTAASPLSETRSTARSATAARLLATADDYVGIRYRYGGARPAQGFDCSGFVQYVFARNGIALPRTSRQQATAGRRLSTNLAALRPGDLMLFASRAGRIDHVAIYVGDGRIIHSSPGIGGVGYDDLSSPRGEWFRRRYVAARRVLRA